MKNLVFALILCVAPVAHAHVLLTTPFVVSGPPGVTTCSAPHATATNWTPYKSGTTLQSVTIVYSLGTATSSDGVDTGWTTAPCAPTYTFTLNLVSGAWTLTISTQGSCCAVVNSGTFAGVTLSTAASNYTTENATQFQDTADQFLTVTGSGLLPVAFGTQPDLWALGDQ